jgi:outer membrane protein
VKNLSLVLNVILLIAVCVLFYLHFSSKGQTVDAGNGTASGEISSAPTKAAKQGSIYFVNIDTVNEKYDLMKDVMKNLNDKKSGLQAEYQRAGKKYQEEGMSYQKQLNDNTIGVDEARKIEAGLKKQEQHIMDLEAAMEKLQDEAASHQDELQKEVDSYMKEYGKKKNIDYVLGYSGMIRMLFYANDSLDVTSEVLAGLNERYKAKKDNSAAKK